MDYEGAIDKMAKAGILTFYYNNYNFGGQLQARALVRAIETTKIMSCEQLQFDAHMSWSEISLARKLVENIRYHGFGFLHKRLEVYKNKRQKDSIVQLDPGIQKGLVSRMNAFERYQFETPHSAAVYNSTNILDSLNDYDCFICGGDQIWNDWGTWHYTKGLDIYTLDFVPNEIEKFSYAPSVPLNCPKRDFSQKLGQGIKKLDSISVRERSSVPLIEKLAGKKAEVVVDPVLLLNREQWDEEIVRPKIDGKYMVCYLLGEGKLNRQSVQKLAKRLGLSLVTFPHIAEVNEDDIDFGDIQDYTSGPAEFVGLISGAEMVVTDSFHAAVFSMIYHKPFYVLERTTKVGGSSMGSRLTDFLSEYKLESQSITAEQLSMTEKIPQIDYRESDQIWERRRMESYEYLKKNLKKK